MRSRFACPVLEKIQHYQKSDELDNPPLLKSMAARGGNCRQPKKPKNRQKIAKTTKQAKVKLNSKDLEKIHLIKEIFSLSDHAEVSKKDIVKLATKAAVLLDGKGAIGDKNRFVISWNNGNKKDNIVSFEMAHNPPSFSGYKKTKAIKSIIMA